MSHDAGWQAATIDRRLTEIELTSAAFDSANEPCSRRVFLFTSPRSASFTACRFLLAAGWGVPCEYFINPNIVEIHSRFCERPQASVPYSELSHYRRSLEERRSRNGIFAAKVFQGDYRRLRAAFRGEEGLIEEATKIFLYRRDFAGQVISAFVAKQNWQYSFVHVDNEIPRERAPADASEEAERIGLMAEILLRSERAWFHEFAARGWLPIAIASETLLADPLGTMTALQAATGLSIDRDNIARCQSFEAGARYMIDRDYKDVLMSRHADLLARITERRQMQFQELGSFLHAP